MAKQLSPLETLALSKAIKETAAKTARDALTEGAHDVDFTAHVYGTLLVAPPQPYTVKQDVESNRLIALLFEKLDPRVRAQLIKFVERELEGWRDHETDDQPNVVPSLLLEADRLLSFAHREKETTKRGNVTAPLSVELVRRGAKCPR